MSFEVKTDLYANPSNVAEFYLKHVKAMKPAESMPEGKSFGVTLEGFSLSLLRDLAKKGSSVGKMAVVVVPWPTSYEVQRLPDGSDVNIFYRYLNDTPAGGNANVFADSIIDMKRITDEYHDLPFDACLKYDGNMLSEAFNNDVISTAYLQRRLANLASYRKAPEGSTKRFKATLDEAIKEGVLTPVEKDKYDYRGKLYQIN